MDNKNFKKSKNHLGQDIHPEFANLAAQQKKEKLNEKRVTVGGKKYIIKKWKHSETLSMLPAFAHLLYVPTAAMAADQAMETEGIYIENPTTAADMISLLFHRLAEIEVVDFMKSMLSEVYLEGKTGPIDIDEDVENPRHIIELVIEVADANFLIGLCQDMCASMTKMVAAQQMTNSLSPQEKL